MAIAPARSIFAEMFAGLVRVQTQSSPFSRPYLPGGKADGLGRLIVYVPAGT
jgi:hypothetical protein